MSDIVEAVAIRLRTIAMNRFTNMCGLAPLLLKPGEGTGDYRGVYAIVLCALVDTMTVTTNFSARLATCCWAKDSCDQG